MTNRRLLCTLIAALAVNCASAETWTYRGSLLDAGQPAQGRYDFRIALYTEPLAGKLAVPAQTLSGLDVKDGHFSAELDLDAKLLAHSELWLAVEVGDGQGGFVALDARTRIVPKAVQATGCWDLQGNAGIDSATNFLGTTDNIAVRFRVGNRAAFSITPYPFAGGQPQLVSPGTVINTNNAGIVAFGGGSDPGVGHVATGVYASIGGGATNEASGNYAHVGGGSANKALSTSTTVGGGYGNTAGSATPGFGGFATVAGGESNTASGGWAFVGSGELNTASGGKAFVGSGTSNFATGANSAVPGGSNNSAGDNSFAAGSYAKAVDSGSFVWADASAFTDFSTTLPNQFLVRANGGVMLNTNSLPATTDDMVVSARVTSGDADGDFVLRTRAGKLFRTFVRESDGAVVFNPVSASGDTKFILGGVASVALRYLNTSTGGYLSTSGVWTDVSSRDLKTDFKTIDTQSILGKVLALPVSEWSYRVNPGTRHVGPVAEDFHASFGLGESDTHIASLDSTGVALAAIQGLNAKLESENAQLRADIEALQAAVATLQGRR